jgi:DNA-binding protein YbaB
VTGPEESLGALERTLAELPRQMAEIRERVSAAAAAEVSGSDLGDLVTVTASGAGEITSVRVSDRARRDLGPAGVAERVVAAVNDALAQAEASLTDAAGPLSGGDDAAARLAAFEDKMDDILDRLTRIDRDLEDRFGD